MENLEKLLNTIDTDTFVKAIFHSPLKESEFNKIIARKVKVKGQEVVQFEKFTQKQAFHDNCECEKFIEKVLEFSKSFAKITLFTQEFEYNCYIKGEACKIVKVRLKQSLKSIPQSHNIEKNYLLPQGEIILPLIDLGIFTKEGKIINSKYDKYKQINRFLELVQDVLLNYENKKINIVDFGCGKSYLTFFLYHYLEKVCKFDVNIIGLDLKESVINNCNELAKKYNYTNLKFVTCDIKDYIPQGQVDMVISLHACDTATDYALENAVKWGSKVILSVPCCQHQINGQIESERFSLLTKYGIVKERISALFTDIIRADCLEYMGYKTQILEFVDFSHSPKNLLIRAVKGGISKSAKEKAKNEIDALLKEFNLSPKIIDLLKIYIEEKK